MGQTLQNGIYLPAEGERNCYDGLEGNWRSLDGLISTVSGKASATHTHGNLTNDGKVGTTANKPLITGTGGAVQAGSFGNQANTFCEGNDSRLSDARTPVAHTHTKSDVTDLLNSNFIPSANNSYDLGSSSYQWNNLYAKKVNTQSVNGINPGALSLPKTESGRYSLTELSSISGIDVDNWPLDGSKIVIDANLVLTGWLYVSIACGTDGYVVLSTGGYSYPNCFYKSTGTPIAGYASAMIPIVEGIALTLYLKGTSLIHARYYPAAGNV